MPRCLLTLLICTISFQIWSGENAKPTFESLIRGLASDEFQERDKATQALAERFMEFREPLRKLAGKAGDPEVRLRLQKVLVRGLSKILKVELKQLTEKLKHMDFVHAQHATENKAAMRGMEEAEKHGLKTLSVVDTFAFQSRFRPEKRISKKEQTGWQEQRKRAAEFLNRRPERMLEHIRLMKSSVRSRRAWLQLRSRMETRKVQLEQVTGEQKLAFTWKSAMLENLRWDARFVRVQERIDLKVCLVFYNTPLIDILRALTKSCGLALGKLKFRPDKPTSIVLRPMPLRLALDTVCALDDLKWRFEAGRGEVQVFREP